MTKGKRNPLFTHRMEVLALWGGLEAERLNGLEPYL